MRSEDVTSVTISGSADSSGVRLSPGNVVEVVAGEAAHGGWCVARLDGSGPVVFVRHALPGERVRARITEVTARFARADAAEILAPSADRVEPPCPYARPGGCGGCDWQHASLPAQRELKASVVRQQLRRIAGIDRPVTVEALPGDEPGDTDAGQDAGKGAGGAGTPGLGWRTRVKFAVRGDGMAGLRAHRSHEVINVADCLIAHPGIRDLGVPEQSWPRAASVEAVVATDNGERAVIVSGQVRSAALKQTTAESVLAVASRSGLARPGPRGRSGGRGAPGRQSGNRTTLLRGHSHLLQRAAGRTWRVSATGFWQVHPAAADTLARAVLDALRPQPGDTVLDLYCGAGLFTGVLAEAVGPDGTVDRHRVRLGRRPRRPPQPARDTVGERVPGRREPGDRAPRASPGPAGRARPAPGGGGPGRHRVPGPPRPRPGPRPCPAGQPEQTTRRPVSGGSPTSPVTRPPSPGTSRIFAAHGWRLESLRAFDAFPMTHHVECLATLVSR